MPTDYLPFATGGGANVIDQPTFAAASWVGTGFSAGLAQSPQLNKVWRQSSMISAAIAQYIATQLGISVLDDGNLATLITNFTNAIVVGAGIKVSRLIVASTNMNILLSDYAVGFNRTGSPAALNAQMPTGAQVGQEFVVEDLAGNANAFPITILPPAGHTLAGANSYVLRQDKQSVGLRFYGSSIWSLRT